MIQKKLKRMSKLGTADPYGTWMLCLSNIVQTGVKNPSDTWQEVKVQHAKCLDANGRIGYHKSHWDHILNLRIIDKCKFDFAT